MKILINADQE